jgi:hypothetical protein
VSVSLMEYYKKLSIDINNVIQTFRLKGEKLDTVLHEYIITRNSLKFCFLDKNSYMGLYGRAKYFWIVFTIKLKRNNLCHELKNIYVNYHEWISTQER